MISIINTRGRARAVVALGGHDGRGLRHAAPLGVDTLAARIGRAHQNFDKRASSDALLASSRHRGRCATRTKARQEQMRIAPAAAIAISRR